MKIIKNTIRVVFMMLIMLLAVALYWTIYSYGVEINLLVPNKFQSFFIIGVPVLFIAWPIGIFKALKERKVSTKYGIRFWGAIKNVPDYFVLFTYVLMIAVLISFISGNNELGLLSVFLVFYYVSLLILFSSIFERKSLL